MTKQVTFKTTYLDIKDLPVTIEWRQTLPEGLSVEELLHPSAKNFRDTLISNIHRQHLPAVAQKSRQACIHCDQPPKIGVSFTDNGGLYAESAESNCWVVPVCGDVCLAFVETKLMEATGDNNRMDSEKFQTAVNNSRQQGPAAPTTT